MGIIVLCIVFVILFLLLFGSIAVQFKYDGQFSLKIKFCGIPIPIGSRKKKKPKETADNSVDSHTEEEIKEDGQKEKTPEEESQSFLDKLSDLKEKIKLIQRLLKSFLKYSRKRIVFKELDAQIVFGTQDAAKTAITVGILWSALYGALPLLDKVFMVKEHRFSVHPAYNQSLFSARVEGIIRTRAVHIIFIAVVLGIQWLKYKKQKKAV